MRPDKNTCLTTKWPICNGTGIPCLGYGTYKIPDPEEAYRVVCAAIKAGYRHIDTAAFYKNESGVGRAVRDSGLPREELFITSKVWKTEDTYDKVMTAWEETMKEIGLDYLDLYLVHWPAPVWREGHAEINREVWRAMMDIYKTGKVKAIGVSNFLVHHLETIMDMEIPPMVDQIEINPGYLQKETVDYCQAHNILVEAWSPLGRGKVLNHPALVALGEKYGRTSAQVILRWELQHGVVPMPKSVHEDRIESNKNVFNFELSEEDMKVIDQLECDGCSHHHPDRVD